MSMGTHLVVVGVGQAGHQPQLDPATVSDDQGGSASYARALVAQFQAQLPTPLQDNGLPTAPPDMPAPGQEASP